MRLFLLYLTVIFLVLACNSSPKRETTDFTPTFEKPYTTDLKYYHSAIEYWQSVSLELYVAHFPESLEKGLDYKFYFVPRILQGGSYLELSIQFKSSEQAEEYFKRVSLEHEIEFLKKDDYLNSSLCTQEFFSCDSSIKLVDFDVIRVLKPSYCMGKGDTKLGGPSSSIFLDLDRRTVVCIAENP